MTASEMASKANANRKKRLGKKGLSEYMKQVASKRKKLKIKTVDKVQKTQ